MPNELPTDRLPTIEETRAMHERAVRAKEKKAAKKRSTAIGLVLLALARLPPRWRFCAREAPDAR